MHRPRPARRPAARELLLALLGDRAAADPHAAVTHVLQRTWIAPAPTWGPPPGQGAEAAGWEAPPGRPVGPGRAAPRRWYRRKRFLVPMLVVGLILLAALNRADDGGGPRGQGGSGGAPGGSAGRAHATTAAPRPRDSGSTAGPRRTARDGKLEFTVTLVSCNHATVGKPPFQFRAGGQFCLVRLQVRNISSRSWTMFPNQFLIDTVGDSHRMDVRAGIAVSSQRLLEQLEPGERVSGTLVFDLTRSVRPERLELHDSPLSGGVGIRVSRT